MLQVLEFSVLFRYNGKGKAYSTVARVKFRRDLLRSSSATQGKEHPRDYSMGSTAGMAQSWSQ
jgi:hypothetical protein